MNKKTQADKLNTIIRHAVLTELEAILPDLMSEIRSAVEKQVSILLEEQQLVTETVKPEPKRSPLDRKRLAEIIGAEFDGETILATTRTMQTRAPVAPADPTDKAEIAKAELVNALTRDYSGLMARLNSIRPDKPNDIVKA